MSDSAYVIEVNSGELVDKVLIMKGEGYRLVQISCTKKDGFEITYSFGRDYELKNFRTHIDENTEIESVSNIFMPAYLYENEMHDLFGVKVKNIKIDYQGTLYRLKSKTPFNPQPLEKKEE